MHYSLRQHHAAAGRTKLSRTTLLSARLSAGDWNEASAASSTRCCICCVVRPMRSAARLYSALPLYRYTCIMLDVTGRRLVCTRCLMLYRLVRLRASERETSAPEQL